MKTMLLLKNCKGKLDEIYPQNDVTVHAIRQWALSGKIKSVMVGRKRLINFESLLEYLENGDTSAEEVQGYSRIRPIKV